MSVYHTDGRGLMLTHYCVQGNQARLRATAIEGGRVSFSQIDATNLSAAQSVLHDLVFALGPDPLERTEIYRAHDGTTETTVFHFARR